MSRYEHSQYVGVCLELCRSELLTGLSLDAMNTVSM